MFLERDGSPLRPQRLGAAPLTHRGTLRIVRGVHDGAGAPRGDLEREKDQAPSGGVNLALTGPEGPGDRVDPHHDSGACVHAGVGWGTGGADTKKRAGEQAFGALESPCGAVEFAPVDFKSLHSLHYASCPNPSGASTCPIVCSFP